MCLWLQIHNGPICIALLITILIFNKDLFKNPFKFAGIFLLCGIIGFLITNGFWMYRLYITFGNPIMPHYSEIFHNNWINTAITVQGADLNTYHPIYLREFLKLPIKLNDIRFSIIIIIFLINLCIWNKIDYKEISNKCGINLKFANFLLIFCILSMLFMYKLILDLRYLSAITALSGIILIAYTEIFIYYINGEKFKY